MAKDILFDSETVFTIPTHKLDADHYNAEDIDGATEGVFGSGSIGYASMQAAQTDAEIQGNSEFRLSDYAGDGGSSSSNILTANPNSASENTVNDSFVQSRSDVFGDNNNATITAERGGLPSSETSNSQSNGGGNAGDVNTVTTASSSVSVVNAPSFVGATDQTTVQINNTDITQINNEADPVDPTPTEDATTNILIVNEINNSNLVNIGGVDNIVIEATNTVENVTNVVTNITSDISNISNTIVNTVFGDVYETIINGGTGGVVNDVIDSVLSPSGGDDTDVSITNTVLPQTNVEPVDSILTVTQDMINTVTNSIELNIVEDLVGDVDSVTDVDLNVLNPSSGDETDNANGDTDGHCHGNDITFMP